MEGRTLVMEDDVRFDEEGNPILDGQQEAELDDMSADAIIQKMSNWERYRNFWLKYYQKKIDAVNKRCDGNICYLRRQLSEFFRLVPHRSTKTMDAYDLPHGRISMSYAHAKFVPNKEAIIERLKKSGDVGFIKKTVKEDLDWNKYKSLLKICDDNKTVVVEETGEIVEDVAVEMVAPEFSVKINDEGDDNE